MKQKLGTASSARRLFALINDPKQSSEGRRNLLEWFDQLLNDTSVTFEHPDFFTKAFMMACRQVEATKKPSLSRKNIWLYNAWQAYEELQESLTRTAKGETLDEIASERAGMKGAATRRRRAAAR